MKKILLGLSLTLSSCGCEVVDTGHRGVKVEFGKVIGEPLSEGFYFYNPVTSGIVELSVMEEKYEGKTSCFTKDTQNVTVTFALTYYPEPEKIGVLYQRFGKTWDEKIILPIVYGSLKDVIGQYVADDLVSKREQATNTVLDELRTALAKRNVNLTTLNLTNLDFDDAYEQAVESKVVAIQKASESKNKTVEVEEQARQKVISAQAEAESMRIRSRALQENKSLVEWEAVQKWDGKMPQYMLGSTTPFINVGKL